MSIHGPARLCQVLHQHVKGLLPLLGRTDEPTILLTPPARISMGPDGTTLTIDQEAEQELEEALEAWSAPRPAHNAYRRLVTVADKHGMAARNGGKYSENLDFMVVDPRLLITTLQAQRFGDRTLPLLERVRAYEFPHFLAHEMTHWAICNNTTSRELRHAMRQARFSFDKERDGTFGYTSEGQYENQEGALAVRRIEQTMNRLNFPELHEHFADAVASALRTRPFHEPSSLPTKPRAYIAAARRMLELLYKKHQHS